MIMRRYYLEDTSTQQIRGHSIAYRGVALHAGPSDTFFEFACIAVVYEAHIADE